MACLVEKGDAMLYWIAEIFRRIWRADAAHGRRVREMTAVERVRLEQAREHARQRRRGRKAEKRGARAGRKDSAP